MSEPFQNNDLVKHISDEFLLASHVYAVSSRYLSSTCLSISIRAVNWSSLNDDAALERMIDCSGTTICLYHEIVSPAIECALFGFIQQFVYIYIYIFVRYVLDSCFYIINARQLNCLRADKIRQQNTSANAGERFIYNLKMLKMYEWSVSESRIKENKKKRNNGELSNYWRWKWKRTSLWDDWGRTKVARLCEYAPKR